MPTYRPFDKLGVKRPALAAVLGIVLALGVGAALTFASTDIPWSAFGSGGGVSSSTNYRSGSTAGQSSAIGESGSTNYDLCAGFWCGATLAQKTPVGGIAELPDVARTPLETGGSSGPSTRLLAAVAGAAAAGIALVVGGAAWRARRGG